MKKINAIAVVPLILVATSQARAQSIEAVGTRALGMGGAFVAVADDATATYWNPAGLPTGANFSVLFDGNTSDLVPNGAGDAALTPETRAQSLTGRAVALATPAFGISYYRIHAVTLAPSSPAASSSEDREDVISGPPGATSLVLQQFGATLVQTISPGFTLGTTVKAVRGQAARLVAAPGTTVDQALDLTEELERETSWLADVDAGVMFAAGPARVGVVARNLREPEFSTGDSTEPVRLERQIRLGFAVTPGHIAEVPGAPTTIAVDVDLHHTTGVYGEQRQVAVGGEQWFATRRIGVRAGFRVNWVQRDERSAAVGLSLAIRSGTFIEGQITRGRDEFERGWSIATRTSF